MCVERNCKNMRLVDVVFRSGGLGGLVVFVCFESLFIE